MILNIQPLGEPHLKGHIQSYDGDPSGLQPELAEAALRLEPEGTAIVDVTFPEDFEIVHYRNTTKQFKLERIA